MRTTLLSVSLVLSMAASMQAQQSDPSKFQPPTPAEISEPDPVIQAAAEAMLRQAATAYQAAPAIIAKTIVRTHTEQADKAITVNSVFGPDGLAKIEAPDSLVYVRDGVMRVIFYDIYDRYLEVPVGGSMVDGVEVTMGDRAMAGFEAMLREGLEPREWLESLLMRTIGTPHVTGLESVTAADGMELNRILVTGAYGTGWIDYDPKGKRIVAAHAKMRIVPDEDLEPFELTMDLTTETEFLEALPSEVTFDPGIRTPVSTRNELDPVLRNRKSIGQMAPALKLLGIDGTEVDLTSMRGKYVLLGFWTSWAQVSRRGINQLEALHRHSLDPANGVQLECFAVDVMERTPDYEPRRARAEQMWKQVGLSVPNLIERGTDTSTAWGITTVPYLVLIGPDGVIVDQQIGFSEDWPKRVLKTVKPQKTKEADAASP